MSRLEDETDGSGSQSTPSCQPMTTRPLPKPVGSGSGARSLRPSGRSGQHRVIAVLDLLDRRSGRRFADLDPAAQQAVLDSLADDPEYLWFAHLVNAGFYADPANGGNDDAVSWRMLDWSPDPAGGWPEPRRLDAGPQTSHPPRPDR